MGAISSTADDNIGSKYQGTISRSAFVYHDDCHFTSFPDQPSHFLAFHHSPLHRRQPLVQFEILGVGHGKTPRVLWAKFDVPLIILLLHK
jgi:hypothetical protein